VVRLQQSFTASVTVGTRLGEEADKDRNIVELRESPGWQLGDLGGSD
jgi:hypothetical protein